MQEAATSRPISPPGLSRLKTSWRQVWRILLSLLVATFGCLIMMMVAVVTVFSARRVYSEIIGSRLGRLVLRIWGIRLALHGDIPRVNRQVVYISNHTSTLDLFVLIGLCLPNTRFFLSGFLRKFIPIGIMGYLMGIFYTCPQSQPEKRRKIFKDASRVLKQTGESVYLSPEGERVTTGEIGHFNKGSFHLAMDLQAPIIPIYIQIPKEMNFGKEWNATPGVINVSFEQPLFTESWKLAELEVHRDSVRDIYVELHRKYKEGM